MNHAPKTWSDAMFATGGRKLRTFLRGLTRNAENIPEQAHFRSRLTSFEVTP
ncbi:MAG: hypothetical protein WDO56_30090 [Gammaproteobacteria bacterium]